MEKHRCKLSQSLKWSRLSKSVSLAQSRDIGYMKNGKEGKMLRKSPLCNKDLVLLHKRLGLDCIQWRWCFCHTMVSIHWLIEENKYLIGWKILETFKLTQAIFLSLHKLSAQRSAKLGPAGHAQHFLYRKSVGLTRTPLFQFPLLLRQLKSKLWKTKWVES